MNIKLLVAAAVAGIALTACTGGNTAAPAPAMTTTTTTAVATSTTQPSPVTQTVHVTETETKRVQAPAQTPTQQGPVVDDFGLGALKLGMKLDEATKTGMIGQPDGNMEEVGCVTAAINGFGGTAFIQHSWGVIIIDLAGGMRTAKGIGIGSTADRLKAAYPNITKQENGPWYVKAEKSGAEYQFEVQQGEVTSARLVLPGTGCHP